jgi:hypothetical protein
LNSDDASRYLLARLRSADRLLGWRQSVEAALCGCAAGVLALAAIRADAREHSTHFDRASAALVAVVAVCAALGACVAWCERRRSRWPAPAWWDDRLQLDGALVTACEQARAANARPTPQALVARVGAALPRPLELVRRIPPPLSALSLVLLALAAFAAAARERSTPLESAGDSAFDALARGIAAGQRSIEQARASEAAAARKVEPGTSAVPELERALRDARAWLAEATRQPSDPALAERARLELERLQAGRFDSGAAAGTAPRGPLAGATDAGPSAARSPSPPAAADALGAGALPELWSGPLAPAESALVAAWIEARRERLRGAAVEER